MRTQKIIKADCNSCDYQLELPVTDEQIEKLNSGALIQNVLPNVSPGDRELFISGICGGCFDNMFAQV